MYLRIRSRNEKMNENNQAILNEGTQEFFPRGVRGLRGRLGWQGIKKMNEFSPFLKLKSLLHYAWAYFHVKSSYNTVEFATTVKGNNLTVRSASQMTKAWQLCGLVP